MGASAFFSRDFFSSLVSLIGDVQGNRHHYLHVSSLVFDLPGYHRESSNVIEMLFASVIFFRNLNISEILLSFNKLILINLLKIIIVYM